MIRIAITAAAFDAIAGTLRARVLAEPARDKRGQQVIRLERLALHSLDALRQRARGSILQLAEIEAPRPGRWWGGRR